MSTSLFLSALLAAAPVTTAAGATPLASSPPTVVLPMFFSDIAGAAELIAVGTAHGFACRWEDGGRTIRTYVTFGDLSVHKGFVAGGSLTLRLGGGTVGDDTIEVAGMPRFERGKRYALFVAGNGRDISPIVGFHQGCFEVAAAGGREVLRTQGGQELIGIRADRLVLAKRRDVSRPRAPEPLLDARQQDILRRARALAERRARRAGPVAPDAGAASPGYASGNASPILVPPESDSGERLSLAELLDRAKSAGGGR